MQIYEELVARGLIAQVTNEEEIKKLENPDIKSTVEKDLVKIHSGERNFKF